MSQAGQYCWPIQAPNKARVLVTALHWACVGTGWRYLLLESGTSCRSVRVDFVEKLATRISIAFEVKRNRIYEYAP
jgi:hypothetical protein